MGLNDANDVGNQIPAATASQGTKNHVTSSVIEKLKCSEPPFIESKQLHAEQSGSDSEGPDDPTRSSRCTTDRTNQVKTVKRTTPSTVTTTTTAVEFVGENNYSDDEGSDGNV